MTLKKAKMRISEQAMFQETVCVDCLNNDERKERYCNILQMLAINGEHDCIYTQDKLEDGCFFKCTMKRTDADVYIESIMDWIEISNTEEVKKVLEKIEESYHYDVIKADILDLKKLIA